MKISWYECRLRQEEFLWAGFIVVRYVEQKDKAIKVKRHEDGGESDIYPPQNKDIENGRTQWFFVDMHGTRRCLATRMVLEHVSMKEGGGSVKRHPVSPSFRHYI